MDIKIDTQTAIILDLDDTLYNEIDFLKSAYIEIANTIDQENWRKVYTQMFSLYRNGINVFDQLIKEYTITKEELITLYRNHKPNIALFDGIEEFLQDVKSKNGKIGIITDGRSKTQRAKLKALGILPYVDYIIISEEIGTEKPNKQNFMAMDDKLKVKQYYYIGDNLKKDFIAPKTLGWSTIGIIDNGLNIHYNAYEHLTKTNSPDYFIFSISELRVV